MHPLVVVPPDVVVELDLQIVLAAEMLPAHELGFERLVRRFVDRVVVGAALLGKMSRFEQMSRNMSRSLYERSKAGQPNSMVDLRF